MTKSVYRIFGWVSFFALPPIPFLFYAIFISIGSVLTMDRSSIFYDDIIVSGLFNLSLIIVGILLFAIPAFFYLLFSLEDQTLLGREIRLVRMAMVLHVVSIIIGFLSYGRGAYGLPDPWLSIIAGVISIVGVVMLVMAFAPHHNWVKKALMIILTLLYPITMFIGLGVAIGVAA